MKVDDVYYTHDPLRARVCDGGTIDALADQIVQGPPKIEQGACTTMAGIIWSTTDVFAPSSSEANSTSSCRESPT